MAKKIPPMDLMFYMMETAESPKHVGAIQVFQLPDKAPRNYLTKLVKELKTVSVEAPFNNRPHFPRTGMPEWRQDKELDIDYHVRHSALPSPGTSAQLMTVVGRLHGGVLDRHRPGWIFQIIEGLEGSRFAIYTKIHHAYIDGMSGVKRMYGSLSASPAEKNFVPAWNWKTAARSKSKKSVSKRVGATGRAALDQAKAVTELYGSFAKMGMHMLKLRESKAQVPFTAPRTLMNEPVRSDTRSVAVCTLPLDRIREIGAQKGGKVNDVVLTLVDAALQDYLRKRGEKSGEPLVALCPMSLREEGDHTANTQVATVHVGLGKPKANIGDRLQQVIESSSAAKQEARAMSRSALMEFVLILAGSMELLMRSGLDQTVSPSYNVLVSNVPGPGDDAMYMAGSQLLASYPISTLTPGVNLNATVLSHGNSLDFGLLADKHAMPDLDSVVESIERYFAELERLLLKPRRSRSSMPKKSKAAKATRGKQPAKSKRDNKLAKNTRKKVAAAGKPVKSKRKAAGAKKVKSAKRSKSHAGKAGKKASRGKL